jgi:hypothetical protein
MKIEMEQSKIEKGNPKGVENQGLEIPLVRSTFEQVASSSLSKRGPTLGKGC